MASMFPKPQSSDRISQIKGMMGGNPGAFVMQFARTNPQFAAFVQQNQGKSIEQIASENGVDMGAVMRAMGN